MTILFNIVFQFGTFDGIEGLSVFSFLSDLLVSGFGAFIAAFTALCLYKKQVKDNQIADNNKLNKSLELKLKFFSSILNSVIEISQLQTKYFGEFHNKILFDPNELPLLSYSTNEEIKRFVDSPSYENYFHAYCEKFRNVKAENELIDEFRKLIIKIDFLYAQTSNAIEMTTKAKEFDFKRKLKFKQLVDTSINHSKQIVNLAIEENKKNDFIDFLNKNLIKLDSKARQLNNKEMNISFFKNSFIDSILDELIEKFYHIKDIRTFTNQIIEANLLYKEIQFQNLLFADEFKEIVKLRVSVLREIIPIANRLNSEFNKSSIKLIEIMIDDKERTSITIK